MFKHLKELILKQIYKLLIYKIIIIDKKDLFNYFKFNEIGKIEIKTNKGSIYFIFKIYKKEIITSNIELLLKINTYLIEVDINEEIKVIKPEIKNLVGLVIKIMLFKKVNHEILCKAILEKFIKKLLIEENI